MRTNGGPDMTKLYPIGTQLITRRLSQAALCSELFGKFSVDSWLQEQDTGNVSKWNKGFCSAERCHVLGNTLLKPVCEWRVTVTAENQKWLSPVPMVGDLLEFKDPDSWSKSGDWDTYTIRRFFGKQIIDRFIIACPSMVEFLMREPKYRSEHPCLRKIIERTYPNNQRAPLIEWDEVIEPEKERPADLRVHLRA